MENTYKIIEQVCYHALLYLAAYFAPIKESTIIILVLICFDLVTGIWKAMKLDAPVVVFKIKPLTEHCSLYSIFIRPILVMINTLAIIKSAKLRDTVAKTVQYAMFIIAIFLLEKGVLDVSWGLTKIAIFSVGVIESVSLCENLFAISGNSLYSSFSIVLKDKFKALINSLK